MPFHYPFHMQPAWLILGILQWRVAVLPSSVSGAFVISSRAILPSWTTIPDSATEGKSSLRGDIISDASCREINENVQFSA
jgi:hypothetical protein